MGKKSRWFRCSCDFADQQGWRYDLPVIKAMPNVCSAAIVASGGAGKMEHFLEAIEAGAAVLLAASVFHFNLIDIQDLKSYLRSHSVKVK